MTTTEPVAISAAITTAITSTLGVLLFVGVSPDLVGALTLASGAWVAAIAVIVRSRVTPNERVALTTSQAEALSEPHTPV